MNHPYETTYSAKNLNNGSMGSILHFPQSNNKFYPDGRLPSGAPEDAFGYDGGDGMSYIIGECITKIETAFEAMRSDIAETKAEVKSLRWWIIGTGISIAALALIVIQLQAGWFQKNIDATQKASEVQIQEIRTVSETHMEEFRRDSDRNYDLALKALERSMTNVMPSNPNVADSQGETK